MEEQSPAAAKPREGRRFRGVRMRKWGKWVAEVREPNKRSRIWLGSYRTAVAAAKAYDTALFCLRGRAARLNFPDEVPFFDDEGMAAMSAAAIRKKATEVGARVDAVQIMRGEKRYKNPDLNEEPSPESSDEDWSSSLQ
ncbi:ethylene-responsive transcription factor [Canna indica]|uniref:Ethylene-responsive transcription factor n=1 Tax=Canna indica TaxID=4628 RepID=A0AAQ3K1B2_9LILI|nr:ethylene-responsive transcription factor [Canna indica]